jgi:hypothetical protein
VKKRPFHSAVTFLKMFSRLWREERTRVSFEIKRVTDWYSRESTSFLNKEGSRAIDSAVHVGLDPSGAEGDDREAGLSRGRMSVKFRKDREK